MDKELLEKIGRMCTIILGNESTNKELDSLALYIGHALKQPLETVQNSNYAECANYLIGMFDWLQGTMTEQDIVDVLKKYIV